MSRETELLNRLRERTGEARLRYPCVDEDAIAEAERELGFRLPRLLRAIYLQVANGGFGPGFGLIGLEGGATEDHDLSLVEAYQQRETSPFDRDLPAELTWPDRVLPICSHGCAVYSCVDCNRRSGRVLTFNPAEWPEKPFRLQSPSLAEWLEEWLEA